MSGHGPAPTKRASLDSIKRVVADHFHVAVWMFAERRRTGDIVLARQVAMDIAYRFTILSNAGIGRKFGGLDHSTVVHARQQVERRRRDDWEFARRIRAIELELCPPAPATEIQLALFIGPLFDRPFPRAEHQLELAA
jgi:chromosomal replication initiation ATPase DnaA